MTDLPGREGSALASGGFFSVRTPILMGYSYGQYGHIAIQIIDLPATPTPSALKKGPDPSGRREHPKTPKKRLKNFT